ncbi:MAG: hypothetical protein NNA20_02145 [Nitrospira sp.]|nr:hypothetical protein [Nitrospira sp.]
MRHWVWIPRLSRERRIARLLCTEEADLLLPSVRGRAIALPLPTSLPCIPFQTV